jgi:hypothetical protein
MWNAIAFCLRCLHLWEHWIGQNLVCQELFIEAAATPSPLLASAPACLANLLLCRRQSSSRKSEREKGGGKEDEEQEDKQGCHGILTNWHSCCQVESEGSEVACKIRHLPAQLCA